MGLGRDGSILAIGCADSHHHSADAVLALAFMSARIGQERCRNSPLASQRFQSLREVAIRRCGRTSEPFEVICVSTMPLRLFALALFRDRGATG